MFRLFILSSLSVLAVCFSTAPAHAAEAQPGDACTTNGAVQNTGGPEQMPRRTLICNGTTWQNALEQSTAGASLLQIGNDTGSCTTAKLGRIRYNGTSTWEYCNGSTWTALGGGASLSSLTAATATNTINNAANKQTWQWNSLSTETGLALQSSSVTSGNILSVTGTNTAMNGAAIYASSNSESFSNGSVILAESTAANGNTIAGRFITAGTSAAVMGSASATAGTTTGVWGIVNSTGNNSAGVYGYSGGATGQTYGVRGYAMSTAGRGIYGEGAATTGANYGVYGTTASTGGTGVRGSATAATGSNIGGYFSSASTTGYGVFAETSAGTGANYAGYFANGSTTGYGLYGLAYGTTGANYGVYGRSASSTGYGGYFANTHASGGWGLYSEDDIGLAANMYLNWGTTRGSGGYGIRDNAGTIECKNSGGAWAACAGGGGGSLSGLTAATAANTINNAAYAQTWAWNSLGNNNGLTLSTTATTGTGRLLYINASGSTGQNTALYARNAGTNGVAIFCDSYDDYGCRATVQWTSTSDARLKKNIEPLRNEYGLDAIMQLKPVTYNWKEKPDDSRKSLGFIAQDVEKIIPEIVGEDSAAKEITLPDGSTETIENPKAVQYSAIVVPLVKAVQELKAENDALHALNADLLRRVEALEAAGKN